MVLKLDKGSDMATLAAKRTAPRGTSAARKNARQSILAKYMDKGGIVDVSRMASGLFISRDQLAKTAGLPTTTVAKRERSLAAKPQHRLREMLEILARIEDWA